MKINLMHLVGDHEGLLPECSAITEVVTTEVEAHMGTSGP